MHGSLPHLGERCSPEWVGPLAILTQMRPAAVGLTALPVDLALQPVFGQSLKRRPGDSDRPPDPEHGNFAPSN